MNWRQSIGMGGAVWEAPSHAAAQSSITLMGVKKRDRRALFNALCDMEREALAILNAAD